MSKIDDYNVAKRFAQEMSEFANSAANPKRIDKFGVRFSGVESWEGTYGSSSVYSWPDRILQEVLQQFQLELRDIVGRAAARVEREAEKARLDAIDEAREILRIAEPPEATR